MRPCLRRTVRLKTIMSPLSASAIVPLRENASTRESDIRDTDDDLVTRTWWLTEGEFDAASATNDMAKGRNVILFASTIASLRVNPLASVGELDARDTVDLVIRTSWLTEGEYDGASASNDMPKGRNVTLAQSRPYVR